MWTKWLPWRLVVKHAAKTHGFLDPFRLLSYLNRFAQPSEVAAPVELLRAGAIFHARGLINSQAIQHNLDWVWPYWVECQFNPRHNAFVPRAFSLTHINLTNRNWTAVGMPDSTELPIIDPRGLVTPFWDAWSIDSWLVSDGADNLLPSRLSQVSQRLTWDRNLCVSTRGSNDLGEWVSTAEVVRDEETHVCRVKYQAHLKRDGYLVVALRPFNPEGVSFIHEVHMLDNHRGWRIGDGREVRFAESHDMNYFSTYREGDVYHKVISNKVKEGPISSFNKDSQAKSVTCDVGMATAAATFRIPSGEKKEIAVEIPLVIKKKQARSSTGVKDASSAWARCLNECGPLSVPDPKLKYLYDAALRTLALHTAEDIYAGPYTYKRFWFRDAVMILYAMMCAGMVNKTKIHLDKLVSRQTVSGYFRSQDGEWDSNGQMLWLMGQYCLFTGVAPEKNWIHAIRKAAQWIEKKRVHGNKSSLHSGLMKAGFSAEHLGPNDYFYWDNFWSVSGFDAASDLMKKSGYPDLSPGYRKSRESLFDSINRSLEGVSKNLGTCAMPASPYRRLDSGSVGSVVAGYPLRLWEPNDKRISETVNYLLSHCFVQGAFFHDMSHSGINPYLTLHIAQVMLRAGDPRYYDLVQAIASKASPTGQWPEAIHPHTGGGCMGDGQHVWAAAEWVLMIRNMIVREEGGHLILCQGIPQKWLREGGEIMYGPAPTAFGPVTVRVKTCKGKTHVHWDGLRDGYDRTIEVRLPGFVPKCCNTAERSVEMVR